MITWVRKSFVKYLPQSTKFLLWLMISIIFFQLCKLKSLESNLYYPDNQSNKKKKLQRYKMTIGKK